MSRPSDFTAQPGNFAEPQRRHYTWIAVAFLASLAALAYTLSGFIQLPATEHCRLSPRPTLMHGTQNATATSRGGAPCLIAANNADTRVESLRIVTAPSNGWIATRGQTRLVYFPNKDFKGVDTFELELVRRTDTASPLVRTIGMRVKVE